MKSHTVSGASGPAFRACQRSGCPGTIGPEGFCEECGRRAPSVTRVTGSSGGSDRGTASGSTRVPQSAPSQRSGRVGLGAGLVELPSVPVPDPASVLLPDPQVPESRRFCAQCGKPVGRSREGREGRVQGYCPHDGTRYSFVPKLTTGDLVGERYEVVGCLAYGGLGWIYLARDRNLGDADQERTVVLKGLIDTGDADAVEAAVAERRFLVEVDHHSIVRIHDFVTHPDPGTGSTVGYIVMEYVGGSSLRDLLLANRGPDGQREPLPVEQTLAYAIEVLPALGYLHDRSLLYCDFKPDNVMHTGDRLKLIDLGAVCRAGADLDVVWGTVGYQAPEVASTGPSVASDLYTVGRAMAVLSLDFRGFTTTHVDRLPDVGQTPVFERHVSYHRLLARATHRDPDHRFGSADEMAAQALGVLRQVLSAADGVPRPASSALFTGERRTFGTGAGDIGVGPSPRPGPPARALEPDLVAAALPVPVVDPGDPAAAFLAALQASGPADLLDLLASAPVTSPEVTFQRVRAHLAAHAGELATAELATLAGKAADWRVFWYQGMIDLAAGNSGRARSRFDAVHDVWPGELAPQLAVAVAAELSGDEATAQARYQTVWSTDHSYLSAAFGLARVLVSAGRAAEAIDVLDAVPTHAACHAAAQVAATRAQLGGTAPQPPAPLGTRPAGAVQVPEHRQYRQNGQAGPLVPPRESDLVAAASRMEHVTLDAERRAAMTIEVLHAALDWVARSTSQASGSVFGCQLAERPIRFCLERAYRDLARYALDPRTRIALIDTANALRPRTWR